MAFSTNFRPPGPQKDMGVISNNIANVGTVGFKRSDTLFSELFAASLGGTGTQPGQGVTLERIRQDFGQGGFEFTSSQLDLAIDGDGLFVLQNGTEALYSRAGAFRLDSDGFVVNESGANLQGYGADDNGQINTALGNLQISTALLAQKPTEEIVFRGNLDARSTAPVTVNDDGDTVNFFAADDPTSYNFSTTTTVYDSAGAVSGHYVFLQGCH